MSTRNLICVMLDNEYKIANYGQYDGYPSGQGSGVLSFLTTVFNRDLLIEKLNKCKVLSNREVGKLWIECKTERVFYQKYPQLNRDIGSGVLEFIQNNTSDEIMVATDIEFANDSLYCEWVYVIDLDKNTFEVFKGFNKTGIAADARFSTMPKEADQGKIHYYPVSLVKSYDLDNLPDNETFLLGFDLLED